MENKEQYPFDVQRLVDLESDYTIGYYTKGHYPKVDFTNGIQEEWDSDFDYPESEIFHHYARLEPDPDFEPEWSNDEPQMVINDYKNRTVKEDEFPITIINFG